MFTVLMLFGCVSNQDNSQPANGNNDSNTDQIDGPIKIGVVIPLSGSSADVGKEIKKGYDFAQEEINSNGGIEALNGAEIEFVYGDHKGDPKEGDKVAQRLLEDEDAVMLTGAYETGVTMQVAQVAERSQVPFLVPYSAGNVITESDFTYTFRTRPKSTKWVEAEYEFLDHLNDKGNMKLSTVGSLWEDGAWGQDTSEDIKELASKYDYDLISDVSFGSDSQSLTTQLTELKSSNADVILGASYLEDTMKVMETMDSLNFKRPYFSIGTTEIHKDFLQLGDLAEGQVGTTSWLPDMTEETKKVNKEFEEEYNEDMNDDAAYAYSASYIMKEALEKAEDINPNQLHETFRNGEFTSEKANIIPTEDDVITFNENGQSEETLITIGQVQDNKWVTVYPEDYSSKDFSKGQWF